MSRELNYCMDLYQGVFNYWKYTTKEKSKVLTSQWESLLEQKKKNLHVCWSGKTLVLLLDSGV